MFAEHLSSPYYIPKHPSAAFGNLCCWEMLANSQHFYRCTSSAASGATASKLQQSRFSQWGVFAFFLWPGGCTLGAPVFSFIPKTWGLIGFCKLSLEGIEGKMGEQSVPLLSTQMQEYTLQISAFPYPSTLDPQPQLPFQSNEWARCWVSRILGLLDDTGLSEFCYISWLICNVDGCNGPKQHDVIDLYHT